MLFAKCNLGSAKSKNKITKIIAPPQLTTTLIIIFLLTPFFVVVWLFPQESEYSSVRSVCSKTAYCGSMTNILKNN